jgi:hypothetical protein
MVTAQNYNWLQTGQDPENGDSKMAALMDLAHILDRHGPSWFLVTPI